MMRGNLDKDKTPAQSEKKVVATPSSLVSQLKAMKLEDDGSDTDSEEGKKRRGQALRHEEEFKCVKLTTASRLPEIIAMKKAMIDHRETFGDKVFWKQVIDRPLKMQLLALRPADGKSNR